MIFVPFMNGHENILKKVGVGEEKRHPEVTSATLI